MPRHQHHNITQRERRAGADLADIADLANLDHTVVVRRFHIAQLGPLPDHRQAGVDARRLQAGVDHRAGGLGPAEHRAAHEQGVLERQVGRAALVVRVVAVHEDV